MASVGKVLSKAKADVLILDPYMDEKTLTDFAPLAPERVQIRLLADKKYHKPTLAPAVSRWQSQFGASRPLNAEIIVAKSPARSCNLFGPRTGLVA